MKHGRTADAGGSHPKEGTMNRNPNAIVVVAGALAFAAAPVFAGPSGFAVPGNRNVPVVQVQAGQPNEEDLRAFVDAERKVSTINQTYVPQIQAAPDQNEAHRVRTQAQAEMVEAVRTSGLSVEQYNDIYARAQADETLRQRIAQLRTDAN